MKNNESSIRIGDTTITPEVLDYIETLFGTVEQAKSNRFPDDTGAKMNMNTLVKLNFLIIGLVDGLEHNYDKIELFSLLEDIKCMYKEFENVQNGFLKWLRSEKENEKA